MNEITVHHAEPGAYSITTWKNVMVVAWQSRADARAVEHLAQVSNALAQADSETIRSVVHLIGDGGGLPTPEARIGFIDLMKAHAPRLACIAVVVGMTGFLASTLRSLITGMRWASPRSFDFRLHCTIDEVLKWLPEEHLKRSGEQLDPIRLRQVLTACAEARRA